MTKRNTGGAPAPTTPLERPQGLPRSMVVLGGVCLGVVGLLTVVSYVWTPSNPLATHTSDTFLSPSLAHLLGTDEYGRDELSRLMAGGRSSLGIALGGALLATVLGGVLGIFSAMFERIGLVATFVIDLVYGFPALLLALVLVAYVGTSSLVSVLAIGIGLTPFVARVIRANSLVILRSPYVKVARTYGQSRYDIVRYHLLGNLGNVLIAQGMLALSVGIVASTALAFLGLGPAQPTPSWGSALAESQNYLTSDPWLSVYPIVLIVLSVLGASVIGDLLSAKR